MVEGDGAAVVDDETRQRILGLHEKNVKQLRRNARVLKWWNPFAFLLRSDHENLIYWDERMMERLK